MNYVTLLASISGNHNLAELKNAVAKEKPMRLARKMLQSAPELTNILQFHTVEQFPIQLQKSIAKRKTYVSLFTCKTEDQNGAT